MHLLCWNSGQDGRDRVGLLEDVEGLCLHIVHSKSSTPDPEISHRLTEEELDDLAVSDCRAFEGFMQSIPRVFRGSLVFLPVCFTVGLAKATCKHAGRTNANWFHQFHPISNFTISPYFGIIFTCFHHFRKFSLNVGKETTAFEPGRKIAGKVPVNHQRCWKHLYT